VQVTKLQGTDAFVVVDLEGAEHAVGITRLAPKVLVDGASLLARSVTYQFATFERQVSGASAAINSKADGRDEAVAAFVAEVAPLVAAGTFLTQPGKGLGPDDLRPLAEADGRGPLVPAAGGRLVAATVAEATGRALGGLDGARVVLEGVDGAGLDGAALVRDLAAGGASVVAVSTADGTVRAPAGSRLGADALAGALADGGVAALGLEVEPAGAVFGVEAEALVCGSKAGVVDHEVAAGLAVRAVVPCGPVPVTAKALAVLRRAAVVVVPDFVATAGPVFGSWRSDGAGLEAVEDVAAEARAAVAAVLDEVAGHEHGPLLGACLRAEAFLRSWRDELPFGRPLA
jgi:glutamate dehydrogenase/leucine dehydrogenase